MIDSKKLISCNNMALLAEVHVEVTTPISINHTFLKLIQYQLLYNLICLCLLLFCMDTLFQIKLKLQLYKSPLPNLKSFLLKYPKYLLIIKPNLKKEYLDPLLKLIQRNSCCTLPYGLIFKLSLEYTPCNSNVIFIVEVLYELINIKVFIVERGKFISVEV